MGRLLRYVVILLLVAFAISVFRMLAAGMGKMFQPAEPRGSSGDPAGGELKRDPVCGTYVLPANAVNLVRDGETLYFCSEACREKFK